MEVSNVGGLAWLATRRWGGGGGGCRWLLDLAFLEELELPE